MEEQTEKHTTRNELADYLETWATQLRTGNLLAAGEALPVPDDLEVRFHFKQKKGQVRWKLEWRWLLPVGAAEPVPHVVIQERSRFKQVKKDLAVSFKHVKRAAQQGISPDDEGLQRLVASSHALVAMAEPEWEAAAKEYQSHLDNLMRAVQKGDRESVLHEIQDLENRMVVCHREYK
jgi:XXXCH domain-containing protein